MARYIEEHALLAPRQKVTVALSGGADSVCLLLLLHEMGFGIEAAHCNFHLRGQESDRDQRFAEDLCTRLGIQLHIKHFDTTAEARRSGQSIEMAARELRYRWFATLGHTIAIAHHRDDNVETMLLNLVRGTGLRGLCGIQPRAEIHGAQVVRPLLCISRQQILAYLANHNCTYVTDSTNLETVARRNIIRLKVLPLLAELNPSIADTLQQDMTRLGESQRLVDEAILYHASRAMNADGSISIDYIDSCPAPLTLLHHLLSPYGFNAQEVYHDRHGRDGAVHTTLSHRLLRHDGRLTIRPLAAAEPPAMTLPEEGTVCLPDGRQLHIAQSCAPIHVARSASTATLDLDSLALPLTLRPAKRGDRFRPFGMKGTKLVSDYLTDLHLSLFDKEDQCVVADAKGDIVWLVGRRIAQNAAITPHTRRALTLRIAD